MHVKSDIERGPEGAWAYRTRTILDLSVEQVIERLPTRYNPATLRKVEGGSAKAGRRMLGELWDLYRAEAEARGKIIAPPTGLVTPAASSDPVVAAIDRQTKVMEDLVGELRLARSGESVRLAALEQVVEQLVRSLLPGQATAELPARPAPRR
jgi:hypothetical protein